MQTPPPVNSTAAAQDTATATAQTSSAPKKPTTDDPIVRNSRLAALAGLVALIALGLAWELWLAPTGSGTLALKVVPLVLCLAGLWRHRMYTFRWLSMLVWLYCLEGITRAMTEDGTSRWLALAEIVLSIYLFACSSLYIRWRLRQAKLANPAPTAA